MPDGARTLIKGGTVITVDPAIGDFSRPATCSSRTARSSPSARASTPPDAEVIDATDCLVLPGLVDTHRHTWQALFRNIASDWTLAHYFTGLHGTMSELYRPAGHLRRQPDRHARGARLRDHDAARLVAQPEHAGAHRRRDRRARRVGLPRRLRPRRRLRALGSRSARSTHPADDVRRAARGPPLLRRRARHALPRAARQPVRDDRGDGARTGALADELGIRISCHAGDGEWGQERPIAQLARARPARRDETYVHCNSLADDELRMMADAGCTASVLARHRAADGPRLARDRAPARRRDPPEPLDRRLLLERRPPVRDDAGDDRHRARLRQRGGPRPRRAVRQRRWSSPAATCSSSRRSRARAPAASTARSAASRPASAPT